jgi:hypothetical protein
MIEQSISVDEATMKRVERGRKLVDQVERHGDLHIVKSAGKVERYYTISLDNINGECCECADWQRHGFGHVCKHIYAVVMFESRRHKTARPKVIRHA